MLDRCSGAAGCLAVFGHDRPVTAAGNRQQFAVRHAIMTDMTTDTRHVRPPFRDLNLAGRLLLPNAWDAASARVFEDAGFAAIGTTSAGIANARGLADGECIGRDAMVREIASIAAAVNVPVTADIEAGYGDTPADVADTVTAVLDAGAVGVNLEDSRPRSNAAAPLYGIEEQTARIHAARAAGERRGLHLVINARTDTVPPGPRSRPRGARRDDRRTWTGIPARRARIWCSSRSSSIPMSSGGWQAASGDHSA